MVLTQDSIQWNDDYLVQADDDLGKALLKLAWLNGPLDQINPTTSQLGSWPQDSHRCSSTNKSS